MQKSHVGTGCPNWPLVAHSLLLELQVPNGSAAVRACVCVCVCGESLFCCVLGHSRFTYRRSVYSFYRSRENEEGLAVSVYFKGRHSEFDVHVTVHRDKFLVIKPTRCTHFSNLFWNETLHVSDSSSVHYQEFFTVHTTMVYVIQVCWQFASRIRMEF